MTSSAPRGWAADVPPAFRELAERALVEVPRQLEALQLASHDLGSKSIGLMLGIDESSVRGLLRRARTNIKRERAAETGVR